MRILVAEDDSILADGLLKSLRKAGYAVDWAKNGQEADAALAAQPYDLAILDIGMPKMTGLEVLSRLRGRNSNLPVLILTALNGVDDRVRGLDLGADDYLTKPFQLAELEARVRALTRRGMCGAPTMLVHGPLCFDQVGRRASLEGEVLELSARELGLLEILVQRGGRRLLFVSADDAVAYGHVVQVMDLCRSAGAENIGIVTDSLAVTPAAR